MKIDERIIALFAFSFIFANIILYIIYKFTKRFKILHAIISTVDNLVLIAFASLVLYQKNPYFVIFVPCFLFFIIYPISYGLNNELSDEEKAKVVGLRGFIFLPPQARNEIKLVFLKLITFPFCYVIESWKQVFSKE